MTSVWIEPRRKGRGKTWLVRWKDRGGRRGSAICYSKPSAMEYSDKKRDELRRFELGLRSIKEPKAWSVVAVDYLRTRQFKASSTQQIDNRAIGLFSAFIGKMAIQNITLDHLENFRDHLLKLYNPNSVRIWLRHLRTIFRWASKHALINTDPFIGFEMPPAIDVRRYIMPEEFNSLLASMPDISRRALIVVIYTGLRAGELLKLDWSMIKPPKGNDPWILTTPKSKVRRANSVKEITTKSMALHPSVLEAMGKPKKGPIFPGITKSMIQQAIRRATYKLNLGRIRWHDMRHTWATDLMEQSKDLFAVMAVGGWKSQAAASIYQHTTPTRRDSTLLLPTRNTTDANNNERRKNNSPSETSS